jgi:hypothetical protein
VRSEHVSQVGCWLARFSEQPCEGELRKVHLISKQVLRRVGYDPWDERAWVWACGGPWPGLSGHHGLLDSYRLRIPRCDLPEDTLALAEELGLEWWIERRFG